MGDKLNFEMSKDEYHEATGDWPTDDELEKVNCDHAGEEYSHTLCGWCLKHDKPRFQCIECGGLEELTPRIVDWVGATTAANWAWGTGNIDTSEYTLINIP